MNKQFNLLLDDSRKYYQSRILKKALNTAQIALEFGKSEPTTDSGIAEAYLLLAKIYTTNGQYQNEPLFYDKALYCLSAAEAAILEGDRHRLEIDKRLIEGFISLLKKDYQKARTVFQSALMLAENANDLARKVKVRYHLGLLGVANNDAKGTLDKAKEIEKLLANSAIGTHPGLFSKMYLLYSQAYLLKQSYSKSLEMSQLLLQTSRSVKYQEMEVVALRNIAVVCGVKSNYKIGMQYFLEALDKSESIGYREMSIQIEINIATLYAHLFNYEEAIRRYEAILNSYANALDAKTKAVVFNNIGNIYLSSENPSKALLHFQSAKKTAQENGLEELAAYSLVQISRSKIALNRLDSAADDAKTAQEILEKHGWLNGKQVNLLNLSRLAFEEKAYEEATKLAEAAILLAKDMGDETTEIRAYILLAMINKAEGNFEKAFEFQEKYVQTQSQLTKVQRSRLNMDMEIRHDIREKQKEIELLTKENDYKSQLLEKTEQITRQNEELRRANDDLKQFAYIASHDLKEPLRMIGSFTQVIHKIAKPHLAEEEEEYFRYVSEGVARMNGLLDGLLRYSTVTQTKENVSEVSLNDVLTLSMANLKIRIMETKAVIERGELPLVKGEQQLFVQLFQNLLSNALKFVQPTVTPYIRVTSEETESEIIISVTDNGIGISEENQTKIFEIFKRLHHYSEYEGTGIGLAICQKIAKRLGGTIGVRSTLGDGATFFLKLAKGK